MLGHSSWTSHLSLRLCVRLMVPGVQWLSCVKSWESDVYSAEAKVRFVS